MYETEEEYRILVRRELLNIEKSSRCTIGDGDMGLCPRCGEDGIWDIAGKGFGDGYGNSIYYSTVFNEWRCRICDMQNGS